MATTNGKDGEAVVIKKYANRRLYNTATSSYVTLDHLAQMVRDGIDFTVIDAKSGDDITRSVLAQIIFDEESKGHNMLPVGFLRQLIGLYGDSLQSVVPNYLEMAMENFAHHQDEIRSYMTNAFGDMFPQGEAGEGVADMGRRNTEVFQQAMSFMNPFLASTPAADNPDDKKPAGDGAAPGASEDLDALQRQMARMQEQLDKLAGDS